MRHSKDAMTYGFRILGSTTNERRLVDWSAAFVGCCECDDRAEVDRESYLSAFCFGFDFRRHLAATGSVRGFAGATWSPWLWFDIDRDDIDAATLDCLRLADLLTERYGLDPDELLMFFSGGKGYHVGLPLSVCGNPSPGDAFNRACRKLAERLAGLAGVTIDAGVYDAVRAFRAPNSRHRKSGLHKRRFDLRTLQRLPVGRLIELAAKPEPFELPEPAPVADQAVCDWAAAVELVENEHRAAEMRRGTVGKAGARLNRATLDFIRDGATSGGTANDQALGVGRHRLLFSAAANLAEFGCPTALAEALLTESALDSGLSPSDVRRQIECGLKHKP